METVGLEAAPRRGKDIAAVAEIIGHTPESLARTSELGAELNFEEALPSLRAIIELFQEFSEVEIDAVPPSILAATESHASTALEDIQRVLGFSTKQNEATRLRDEIIQRINDRVGTYYAAIAPVVAFDRVKSDFRVKAVAVARESVNNLIHDTKNQAESVIRETKEAADKGLREVEKMRRMAEELVGKVGVTRHAQLFQSEADKHKVSSWWWLGAAISLGLSTVGYTLVYLTPQIDGIADGATIGRVVQLAIPRLVILSILSLGLAFSTRNYWASRHNLVVNRHRQNALSSFETFVKASSDRQTSDAVLIQATQAIFAPQSSGYVKADGESYQPPQIVEIMRRLGGESDK